VKDCCANDYKTNDDSSDDGSVGKSASVPGSGDASGPSKTTETEPAEKKRQR
jgi:hypothetical protein